jgi:hypothetical protein
LTGRVWVLAYSICVKLRQTSRYEEGMRVYLVSGASTLPAIITNGDAASLHRCGWKRTFENSCIPMLKVYHHRSQDVERKMGETRGCNIYACDVIWDYYGIEKLSDLTIHIITKRRAAQEMLTPAAQEKWNTKLQSQIYLKSHGKRFLENKNRCTYRRGIERKL